MHPKPSCALAATILWISVIGQAGAEEPRIDFNRDILPLLSDNCFLCHGNDHESREADLRFDIEKSAKSELPSGATAIVPGNLDASELIARITENDSDLIMPPNESLKKLSPEEIELFKQWIAQGAEFKKHWAFETPVRPSAPQVKLKHWVRNPIDQFVLAQLGREKLKPSSEADRVTLICRVTLDLTGLPLRSAHSCGTVLPLRTKRLSSGSSPRPGMPSIRHAIGLTPFDTRILMACTMTITARYGPTATGFFKRSMRNKTKG